MFDQLEIPHKFFQYWIVLRMLGYRDCVPLRYVYTLRLIGPISYPGECDLIGYPRKYSSHFLTECILLPLYVYNMHQDTKSARLIAVCNRSFSDVLPPLRSRVRAFSQASDLMWEVNTLPKVVGFLRVLWFPSTGKNLTGSVRINS